MADDIDDRSIAADVEPARRPSRGTPLADDGPDEDLPALLAIAVGIAVIAVLLVGSGYRPGPADDEGAIAGPSTSAGADEGIDGEDPADDEGAGEDEAEDDAGAGIDLDAIRADLGDVDLDGVELSAEGDTVTASGEVPDGETAAAIIAALEARPGVAAVVDELTVAGPSVDSVVEVAASQAEVVLSGVVGSEDTRSAVVDAAASVYDDDQIVDELEVDEGAAEDVTVTLSGELSDQALFDRLSGAFDGIEGVASVDTAELTQVEASPVEAELAALDTIQFESGTAVIIAESVPVIQEVADVLLANPDVAIEIGGHTDSRGTEAANLALSLDRAEQVMAELEALGVTNELDARGWGERRLLVTPDDTPEAQQANRRIDFFVLS